MVVRPVVRLALFAALVATGGCAVALPPSPALEIGVPGRTTHLDPARGDDPGTTIVARYAFQTLPQIATRVARSNDGRRWTFTLASNRRFADGTSLDATAVAANLTRWRALADTSSRVSNIARVDRPNATTVVIATRAPFVALAIELGDPHLSIASPAALSRGEAAFDALPVGSGAYRVVAHRAGEYALLEPAGDTHPPYASVVLRDVPDPRTALLSLEKDDLAVVYDFPASEASEAAGAGLHLARDAATGRLCAFPADLEKRMRVCPPGASTP